MGPPHFVASKLAAPAFAPGFLHRTRLYRRLDAGLANPLTVVVGPAGVGKSAVVAGWTAERSATVDRAWINADRDDTAVRLLRHLARSIDADERADDVEVELVRALGVRTRPLVVVVDDIHLVQSRHALDALRRLVEATPRSVHLVAIGRSDPRRRIRWGAAEDRVVEVTESDLRLAEGEPDRIAAAHPCPDLPGSVRADLVRRVDGWVAGLQLALAGSAASDDPIRTAAGFGGETPAVAEFLIDELLDPLDPDRREILASASVLDEWSDDGCRAVTGRDDAHRVLTAMADEGLLLGWRTAGTFRCHPLLRDLLRSQLRRADETRYRRLLRVASRLAERRGELVGAVTHLAEAQALPDLLDLCRRRGTELAATDAGDALWGVMRRLPESAYAEGEDALAAAEVQLELGDVVGCALRLDRCHPGSDLALRARIVSLRARCHHHLGDPEAALLDAREAHALSLAVGQPTHRAAVDEAFGLMWHGQLTLARLALASATTQGPVEEGLAARIAVESGELDAAERLVVSVLGPAEGGWRDRAPTRQVLHALVARAQLLVERAEDRTARRVVEELITVADAAEADDALVVGCELRARLRWTGIGVTAGLGALHRIPGRTCGLPLGGVLRARLDRLEVRLHLEAGDLDAAEALLAAVHGPEAGVLRARLLARRGDVDAGLDLLDRVPVREPHLVVEAARARARILADAGRPDAVAAADRLLAHHTATTPIRRLLEEGELLRQALAAGPRGAPVAVALGDLHRVALETTLSARELAILGYLPTRLTNQQIGDQLYISTHTVKTHLKNVYRRLGVSQRTDAVRSARQLGLLAPGSAERPVPVPAAG